MSEVGDGSCRETEEARDNEEKDGLDEAKKQRIR